MLKLPSDLHFSTIFNVQDLYAYHGHQNEASAELDPQLPHHHNPPLEIEYVLDDQLVSTRQGGYHKFFCEMARQTTLKIHGLRLQILRSLILISTNCIKHLTRRSRVLSIRGELMKESLSKSTQE